MVYNRVDGGTYFSGILDEVAIFDVALMQEEVKELMGTSLSTALAVSPADNLATSWGSLKTTR